MVSVSAGVPVTTVVPLVPVTVIVYEPVGVPPPPPPLLPPPQAGSSRRHIRTIPSTTSPTNFLRRVPEGGTAAPSRVRPNTGKSRAYTTPKRRPFAGRVSIALAAVVPTLSVAVVVPFAGGVTVLLILQVGPLVTTGETAQIRVTGALKPPVDPTVIVAVADTPACPDVFDNAPLLTVKLPDDEPVLYFATNASVPPPKVV